MQPVYRLIVLPLVIGFLACPALAQDNNEKDSQNAREFAVFAGVLLPNQIEGVVEQTGLWGFRFAWPKGKSWVEPGVLIANAFAITYFNIWVSYRWDVEVESLLGHVYIGGDLHRITRPVVLDDPSARGDITHYFAGGHVGGGISAPIGDTLWFRSDMKFNLNPGTALVVSFSFVFKWDEVGGQDASGQQSLREVRPFLGAFSDEPFPQSVR